MNATVTVEDIEVHAENLDAKRAAEIYREHGALVVRGLYKTYVSKLRAEIEAAASQALTLVDKAKKCAEGWTTPDGTLWIPAPKNYSRDKQIMCLSVGYKNSASMFQSAYDEKAVDIASAILGPDVELFLDGQCLYKEPVGGHAKNLHQDAAYFQHRYDGPVAVLGYMVDTDLVNGALHVVPGSHKLGVLGHVDTSSHLGLKEEEWPWERALPVVGKAGDAIFFHVNTIHGSKSNHSKASRPVAIHRYRRADDYVVISATTTDNRAHAEQHVEQAKKDNQMGFMVRGQRRYDAGRNS